MSHEDDQDLYAFTPHQEAGEPSNYEVLEDAHLGAGEMPACMHMEGVGGVSTFVRRLILCFR